jgi:glycosyltransferase involved in cell wall biosynthesis
MNFSILISTYYKENPSHLRESLDSVFNQTVLPSEVVLVKDGPLTSELDQVIENYQKKYSILKVITLKKNKGLGSALNEGLKHCSYEWVARMDTDDICYPERFEKQLQYLSENKEIAILGTYISEFNKLPGDINSSRKLPTHHNELQLFSHWRNPLNHPTVMFKKSVIEDVGSYQEIHLFEDFYLWLRVINKGYKIANLPESLVHFRIDDNTIARRHGWNYAKKEYYFYKRCITENLLSRKDAYINFLMRLPIRFVPTKILLYIYKKYLRK